jgi:hypothetical protein
MIARERACGAEWEGRKGGRNEAPRNEVATILERVRQAQESGRYVMRRPVFALRATTGSLRCVARKPYGLPAVAAKQRRLVGGTGIEPVTPSMSRLSCH